MTRILDITIPGEPMSLNNAYYVAGNRRHLTPDATAYKTAIRWEVIAHLPRPRPQIRLQPLQGLRLTVEFRGRWQTQSGTMARRDVSNAIKLLEDSICEALGIDDKHIRSVHAEAIHEVGAPSMHVILEVMA